MTRRPYIRYKIYNHMMGAIFFFPSAYISTFKRCIKRLKDKSNHLTSGYKESGLITRLFLMPSQCLYNILEWSYL